MNANQSLTTNFLITFPDARGYAQEVMDSSGRRLPERAIKDAKRGNRVVMRMNRQTFDSVTSRHGSLTYKSRIIRNAIPDVDFTAYDGTLHATAEAALQHELASRFDVQSLDELAAKLSYFVSKEKWDSLEVTTIGRRTGATQTELEPAQVSIQEAISLVKASVATKGRTPADIQRDTGLPEETVYNILSQNPNLFKIGPGGRYQKAA